MSRYRKNNNTPVWIIILVLIAVVTLIAVSVNQISSWLPDMDEQGQENVPGDDPGTDPTPSVCAHVSTTTSCISNGAEGHRCVVVCNDCEATVSDTVRTHEYGDAKTGICTAPGCAYACQHDGAKRIARVSLDEKTHRDDHLCDICGFVLLSNVYDHEFNATGFCEAPYCEYQCPHATSAMSYASIPGDNKNHRVIGECSNCGMVADENSTQPHQYQNEACWVCQYGCNHADMVPTYKSLNNGKHEKVEKCPDCDHNYINTYNCTYTPESNGFCTLCNAEHPHAMTEDVSYLESGSTQKKHVIAYLCGCGKTVQVTEAHDFDSKDDTECACGYICEHTLAYSYVSGTGHSHTRIEKCSKCGDEFGSRDEYCTDYETVVGYHSDADGCWEIYECTLCKGTYEYVGSPHNEYACGLCKKEGCHGYAADSDHAKIANGATCPVCGEVKDPAKQYK